MSKDRDGWTSGTISTFYFYQWGIGGYKWQSLMNRQRGDHTATYKVAGFASTGQPVRCFC